MEPGLRDLPAESRQSAGASPFFIIDRGSMWSTRFTAFPVNMEFFTSADLLEIGDLPLISPTLKPRRPEVLKYYRRVTRHYDLPLRDYEEVLKVVGSDGDFELETKDRLAEKHVLHCRKIIVATGYFDNPNRMNVPGEELDKLSHYYTEAHPYFGKTSGRDRRQELRRRNSFGTLSKSCRCDPDLQRRSPGKAHQVLGTTGHSKTAFETAKYVPIFPLKSLKSDPRKSSSKLRRAWSQSRERLRSGHDRLSSRR